MLSCWLERVSMAYYSSTKLCVCGGGGGGGHIILRIKVISHALSLTYVSSARHVCGTMDGRIWPRNCVWTLVHSPAGCNLQTTQFCVHYIEAWFCDFYPECIFHCIPSGKVQRCNVNYPTINLMNGYQSTLNLHVHSPV